MRRTRARFLRSGTIPSLCRSGTKTLLPRREFIPRTERKKEMRNDYIIPKENKM